MASILLALGSTAANSSVITLAAGESATIALRGVVMPSGASTPAFVEMQDDTGAWVEVGSLPAGAAHVLTATGSFRLRRPAGMTWAAFRG